ncbi:hypothetical protein RRG08_042227 [Elysia crispata]|uniref:Uncharacterized protein n=1 Tax=Elysia crispata TaxID=231223 RepID=A0AAE1ASN0_9GAST|nr:hypothetical protein RRG08_042227 [Elysia crispata]
MAPAGRTVHVQYAFKHKLWLDLTSCRFDTAWSVRASGEGCLQFSIALLSELQRTWSSEQVSRWWRWLESERKDRTCT